jgi:hypothetical protein
VPGKPVDGAAVLVVEAGAEVLVKDGMVVGVGADVEDDATTVVVGDSVVEGDPGSTPQAVRVRTVSKRTRDLRSLMSVRRSTTSQRVTPI